MASLHARPRWIAAVLSCGLALEAAAAESRKYCIIGAGAAGLQLGHFMKEAGMDYVIWERGDHAGWFFKHYPVHRKLISINRRKTRSNNPEFNLRHDWNSLIEVPVTPFTNWTDDYFPDADVLVEYLKAVAVEQADRILYQHNVLSVNRVENGFQVSVKPPSGSSEQWQCSVVVAATGFWVGHKPDDWIAGLEHTTGYEELSPWPGGKAFEGLSVLVLGNGNAAFETADAVRNYASDIGIVGRRHERRAQDSHYVGDVRGARTTILDALELKSIEDVFHVPTEGARELELFPCASPGPGQGQGGQSWPSGKYDTELRGFRGRPPVCCLSQHDESSFLLAEYSPEDPLVQAALEQWPEEVRVSNISETYIKRHKYSTKKMGKFAAETQQGVADIRKGRLQVLVIGKEDARRLTRDSEAFRKALPGLIATTEGLWVSHDRFLKPYDIVVRALGWRMDKGPFESLNLTMDHLQKYPMVDACFKAQDNLYFAGTLTHGYDKYKYGSAGGFIHGFRYTSKSLFRCLMHQYESRDLWADAQVTYNWHKPANSACAEPSLGDAGSCAADGAEEKPVAKKSDLPPQRESTYMIRQKLNSIPHWSHLLRRINEASGPYQMSCGALVDGMIYNLTSKKITYIEDMPMELFDDTYVAEHRVMWQFRYGARSDVNDPEFLRTRVVAHGADFLHPVLYYMAPRQRVSTSSRMHIIPDRWTDFAGREDILAAEYFLREVEEAMWEGKKPPVFHEKVDNVRKHCEHHLKH